MALRKFRNPLENDGFLSKLHFKRKDTHKLLNVKVILLKLLNLFGVRANKALSPFGDMPFLFTVLQ